jgi:hypothetical protein
MTHTGEQGLFALHGVPSNIGVANVLLTCCYAGEQGLFALHGVPSRHS